jgi:hypothetical protein
MEVSDKDLFFESPFVPSEKIVTREKRFWPKSDCAPLSDLVMSLIRKGFKSIVCAI